MTATLTKTERVRRALRGDEVDRAPISLWHHFPGRDETAAQLAEQTIAFQRSLDLDFIKLMPTGTYAVQDYGARVRPVASDIGTTEVVASPIGGPADWARLPRLDPAAGVLGQQVECVRLVREALGPEVPILQTIFDPLSLAAKLAGADLARQLREHPAELQAALEHLADDVVAFGRACLAAGAAGFFFATQAANPATLSLDDYRRLALPSARRVATALRDGASLTIFHLHGAEPYFELADELPIDAVNWHDRETRPTLAEALARTDRALAAGIHRGGPVSRGDAGAATAEVRDALAQTGGRRLLLAPGCVLSCRSPLASLRAAREAVD